MKSLNDLKINEIGYINKILINPGFKKRLLDLGFITNTPIKPVLSNPSNDSRAYEIRGSLIAIRNSDAEKISLQKHCKKRTRSQINIVKKRPGPKLTKFILDNLLFLLLHLGENTNIHNLLKLLIIILRRYSFLFLD